MSPARSVCCASTRSETAPLSSNARGIRYRETWSFTAQTGESRCTAASMRRWCLSCSKAFHKSRMAAAELQS
eukprot:5854249-Pyramimonas_sp.AAC.1